jgi:hypothetical protein
MQKAMPQGFKVFWPVERIDYLRGSNFYRPVMEELERLKNDFNDLMKKAQEEKINVTAIPQDHTMANRYLDDCETLVTRFEFISNLSKILKEQIDRVRNKDERMKPLSKLEKVDGICFNAIKMIDGLLASQSKVSRVSAKNEFEVAASEFKALLTKMNNVVDYVYKNEDDHSTVLALIYNCQSLVNTYYTSADIHVLFSIQLEQLRTSGESKPSKVLTILKGIVNGIISDAEARSINYGEDVKAELEGTKNRMKVIEQRSSEQIEQLKKTVEVHLFERTQFVIQKKQHEDRIKELKDRVDYLEDQGYEEVKKIRNVVSGLNEEKRILLDAKQKVEQSNLSYKQQVESLQNNFDTTTTKANGLQAKLDEVMIANQKMTTELEKLKGRGKYKILFFVSVGILVSLGNAFILLYQQETPFWFPFAIFQSAITVLLVTAYFKDVPKVFGFLVATGLALWGIWLRGK